MDVLERQPALEARPRGRMLQHKGEAIAFPPEAASPLCEVFPGVIAKFECNNPTGSHKVRAARRIIRNALDSGDIVPGHTTVIEKTGGNFGFGLAVACCELGVPVEVAVGLSFSPLKRRSMAIFGAKLIGVDMLQRGATPREVVEWHLAHADELHKSYFYTDQFNNAGSLEAHEQETGPELVRQLAMQHPQVDSLSFVACAGTGASLMGIGRALRHAGYDAEVIMVEPEGCDARANVFKDHPFEGMSVGVKPPFIQWDEIDAVERVTLDEAIEAQRVLATTKGHLVGNTSAACLAVARRLQRRSGRRHRILTMVYDQAFWYSNTILS